MKVTIAPVDQSQRSAALDPLKSVCVTAPAGSGKTELLSQRVLKLLALVDQPEQILAITFTRKAAAEMHQRIILALQNARLEVEPDQPHRLLSWQLAKAALLRDQQCSWQLLSNTNRLKIQTIDSLCASLTRSMPLLANFGAQPQVDNNPESSYQSAVAAFLLDLETEGDNAKDLATLLMHLDNDLSRLQRLLIILLRRRNQWLIHIGINQQPQAAKANLEKTLRQLNDDLIQQIHQRLAVWSAELVPLLDYAGCNMRWQQNDSVIASLEGMVELPSDGVQAKSQYLAIAQLLLTANGQWRKSINKTSGFPTETEDGDKALAKKLKNKFIELLVEFKSDDELLSLLTDLRHSPAAQFNDQQWKLLEVLARLLPGLVAQLTLIFQQTGSVDYSQISMAALDALGDGLAPSELAMKLDYQLKHILVDEFQDTATPQFRLLQRLLEGWQEYNRNDPANPNTLFIVGDGMQSIYGFREANVGLFLEARKQGVNGVQLQDLPLTVNFRSDPEIVDWVNDIFSRSFPRVENLSRGAVPFEVAHAFNPSNASSAIAVYGFAGGDAREREAQQVVELVKTSQQQNSNGSIAILVRSRPHLRHIIVALNTANISWQATEIDKLESYAPIKDLHSLTCALSNIADAISWAALLRTPFLGFDNRDMQLLLTATEQGLPWYMLAQAPTELSRHAATRFMRAKQVLLTAFEQRQRLPLRSFVEGIWMALGGAASLTSAGDSQLVDAYFDLLEQHQQGSYIHDMADFERAISSLYASTEQQDCQLQVMTIHKAKGLEFDTVILPGMARQPRSNDRELLIWGEYLSADGRESGLLLSPQQAIGDGEDSIYEYLRYEQQQSAKLENTRLLYVAATRAISQLYILFSSEFDKSDELKAPSASSLLASIWPAIVDTVQWDIAVANDGEQFGLDFDAAGASSELTRLASDWSPPHWSFTNPLEPFYIDVDTDAQLQNNIPDMFVDPLPAAVGSVCHLVLEQLANQGIGFWTNMPVQQKQQWLHALFHHQQLNQSLWEQACSRVCHAINNVVGDTKGQWLLAGQQHAANELSLLNVADGGINERIIDRTFIDENGDLWIVDYKTSAPTEGETVEQFLQREEQHYHPQLATYHKLMTNMVNSRTIRTALYFTYLPYWLEVKL